MSSSRSLITLPGGIRMTSFQLAIGAIGLLVTYLLLAPKKVIEVKKPKVNSKDELSEYKPNGKYYAIEHNSCKEVLLAKKGSASRAPGVVMQFFKQAADQKGSLLALESVEGQKWTWREYYNDTITAAKSLVHLGFQQFDSLSLIGFNSPQWVIGNMAAIAAGGKAAGIYTTNAADAVRYIVEHSESKIAICEDEDQLNKFLVNIKVLPKLKAIVVYKGPCKEQTVGGCQVMSWDSFMKCGSGVPTIEVDTRISNTKPGHCAILIYTSGTTGNPKACMISNDSILFEASTVLELIPTLGGKGQEEHIISYLPLSHIAGQMVDVFCPIIMTAKLEGSCCLHFADANALKGSLGDTLRKVRPTLFLGVPRVWEKIQEMMKAKAKGNAGIKLHLANWAKAKGLEYAINTQIGGSGEVPNLYKLADTLIFKTVKQALGLDRCKYAMTGAAPITRDTLTYFGQLGLQINEVYGMSESCAATTFSTDETHIWGSCGFAMPGCEVKIDHSEERGDKPGQGELCYRGRHIMMGYLKDEIKTREAIDPDGWLHSGDLGRMDSNGMFYITGRIKELIVSAGGEKYPPIPCEDSMKKNCPGISNVMMVGDARKYNILLVTLKCKVDKDGNPLDDLDGDALDVDPHCRTVSQARESKLWAEYIKKGIKKYNDSATSNAHKVQYHLILAKDFSVNDGGCYVNYLNESPKTRLFVQLTATLKLKRSVCMEMYKKEIDSLYKD